MDRLPPVLAFDIFQRVPIKSIGRSMCVSKYWLSLIRSLIRTPPFISSYTIESSKIPSNQLLISDESGNKISINRDSQGFESYKLLEVPFEPDDQESFMRGSCNGLICIINIQGDVVLWNPTIRKILNLPRFGPLSTLKGRFLRPEIGFDSLTNDYKVVTYVESECYAEPDYLQVFSLKNYLWQTFPVITPTLRYEMPASFNSVVHFMIPDDVDDGMNILGFDVSSEVYQMMKLPKNDYEYLNVSVFKDYTIGACYGLHGQIDIWVMMEYGNFDSWSKMFSFNLVGSLHFRLVDMSQLSFCFRKNGGLFLQVPWYHGYTQMYKKVIILLDPQIGEKKIIVKDSDVFCDEIFCFFESLVLLDHPSAQSY